MNSKLKKADGEITFFFVMLTLVMFIVILLMIIVIGENNFVFEKLTREMANRISISASVLQAENETELSKGFKDWNVKNWFTTNDHVKSDNLSTQLKISVMKYLSSILSAMTEL